MYALVFSEEFVSFFILVVWYSCMLVRFYSVIHADIISATSHVEHSSFASFFCFESCVFEILLMGLQVVFIANGGSCTCFLFVIAFVLPSFVFFVSPLPSSWTPPWSSLLTSTPLSWPYRKMQTGDNLYCEVMDLGYGAPSTSVIQPGDNTRARGCWWLCWTRWQPCRLGYKRWLVGWSVDEVHSLIHCKNELQFYFIFPSSRKLWIKF